MTYKFIKRNLIIILTVIFCFYITLGKDVFITNADSECGGYFSGTSRVYLEDDEYDINNVRVKFCYALYQDEVGSYVDSWDTNYRYYVIYITSYEVSKKMYEIDNETYLNECIEVKKIKDVTNPKYVCTRKENCMGKHVTTYGAYEEIVIPKELFSEPSGKIAICGGLQIIFTETNGVWEKGEMKTRDDFRDYIYYEFIDDNTVKLWVSHNKNYKWKYKE